MFESLKKLFGRNRTDFNALMNRGARIVDVRTGLEFSSGAVAGSLNVPLDELTAGNFNLPKTTPLITVCASGIRSEAARKLLQGQGYEVYNGGAWKSLERKLQPAKS